MRWKNNVFTSARDPRVVVECVLPRQKGILGRDSRATDNNCGYNANYGRIALIAYNVFNCLLDLRGGARTRTDGGCGGTRITTTKYDRSKCGKCKYCRRGRPPVRGTRPIRRRARADLRLIPRTIVGIRITAPLIRPENVRRCMPSAAATPVPIKWQLTFQVHNDRR